MEDSKGNFPVVRDFRRSLGLYPAPQLDIAVISCDGCPQGQTVEQASDLIVQKLRPHITFQVSVPPLFWEDGKLSLKRCLLADLRIALGCEKRCISKLFSQKCPPHREFIVPKESTDLEVFCHEVVSEIDRQLGIKYPEAGLPIEPAEIAPQRSFISDSDTTESSSQKQYSSRNIPISDAGESKIIPSLSTNRENNSPVNSEKVINRRGYFSDGVKNSSVGIPFISIFLLLLMLGGGFAYWNFSYLERQKNRKAQKEENRQLNRENKDKKNKDNSDEQQGGSNLQIKKQKEKAETPSQYAANAKNDVGQTKKIKGVISKEKEPYKRSNPPLNRPDIEKKLGQKEITEKIEKSGTPGKKNINGDIYIREPRHFIPKDPYNLRWIGGSCLSPKHCENPGGFCFFVGKRKGFCSQSCWGLCPDRKRPGYTMASCISAKRLRLFHKKWKKNSYGYCLPRCSRRLYPQTSGCRPPLRCMALPLYGNPKKKVWVCVPVQKKRNRR